MDEHAASAPSRRVPGAEEYLYALIRCAGWVPQEYKDIAKENAGKSDFLRELYLCACDGVPAEKAREAQGKKQPEAALRFLRQKQIEENAIGESDQRLDKLTKKAAALEKEVRAVSRTVGQIADQVTNLENLFPDNGPQPVSGPEIYDPQRQKETRDADAGQGENTVAIGTKEETADPVVPDSDTKKTRTKKQKKKKWNVPDSGTWKISTWKIIKSIFRKKNGSDIAEYIESLLDAGYNGEQLDFLLDCIEDGLTPEKIDGFASPRLPVDVMRRLRSMERQKEVQLINVNR